MGMGAFMKRLHFAASLAVSVVVLGVWSEAVLAQSDPADILRTLNYRQGSITLGDNLATINLKENFRYLNNADTQTFLTKVWGNPPGAADGALGMLLPTEVYPLSDEGFAIVVAYEASGYVSDEDVEKIDYSDLLRDMKQSAHEDSTQRVAKGYESIELIGWARQPYYDKASKKLYWAKHLRFGNEQDTLNYDIRILGRRGVLMLRAVAGMEALPLIDRKNADILSMVSFNQGNRYQEFNPSIDQAAAYGIAGLIAGGILTKTGFFKGLLVLLLASKKLGAIAIFGFFGALWTGFKALFRRRQKATA
jgi:uncharacterized membrane-anchored protein